jgi:hypothetical protein
MTPTREQLELAAKAAGLLLKWGNLNAAYVKNEDGVLVRWNPTTSNSDSFDLMVACAIDLVFSKNVVTALCPYNSSGHAYFIHHNNDKQLATMWAVFLCAVELGRAM